MKLLRSLSAIRIIALLVLSLLTVLVADIFSTKTDPKILGGILAMAAAIFIISECFFWKAIDKLTELPTSDILSAAQAKALQFQVEKLKQTLISRWALLLAFKVIASVCAVSLLTQSRPNEHQRLVWLGGVLFLTISLPIAMSLMRNWQQADRIKSKQIIAAKEDKEKRDMSLSLNQAPKESIPVPTEVLESYVKPMKTSKSKKRKK